MSETVLRASRPTPNYKLGLAEKNYEAFNVYYGRPNVIGQREKFGHPSNESSIRYVESPNAHLVVNPRGLPEKPMQVLIWGALGRSAVDIARELKISIPTVKAQRANLFGKIGATSLSHAIHVAFREQVLQPTEMGDKKLLLTPRERETLTALSQGLTKEQAAVELGMSFSTIKTHTTNILADNNLKVMTHAITLAFLSGDIPLPDRNPPR